MTRLILLSAGHHPLARGASFGDFNEYDEAREWVDALVANMSDRAAVLRVPTGPLTEKVKWINDSNASLAIEIHFNSDPGHKGMGSETLYCPGSAKGKQLAEEIQQELGAIFHPSRGAKEGWYRMDKPGHEDYPGDIDGDEMPDYFLKYTNCPAILIEPEFIHNKTVIQGYREWACARLADVLIHAVGGAA